MLLSAGHAKNDVPAVVAEARSRHPGIDIRLGAPLGVARELVGILGERIVAAGGAGLPLLVVARGSSDPDANSDACKAARLVGEWTGAPLVHTAFSGVTGPSVTDGTDLFRRLGTERLVVAWWFLCHGRLVERGRDQVAQAAGATEVLDVGHLGPDPRLVPVVLERVAEAQRGQTRTNCDACAYRAPWPGLESRVGQPVGVGHSHLAAEHRAGGHDHSGHDHSGHDDAGHGDHGLSHGAGQRAGSR
jgi:sirohydrochlorin cobaltochelatase